MIQILAGLCVVVAAGASPAWTDAPLTRARYLMGTALTAVAGGADSTRTLAALAAGFDEVARLESALSSWRTDSELSRMNAAAARGEAFACSPALFAALERAQDVAQQTDGAFDPTIEPCLAAWDARGTGRVPSRAERSAAAALVGWRGLRLEAESRTARFDRDGMAADLGGIGKGIALDAFASALEGRGVTRALLDFGGEVLALGGPHEVTLADPSRRLRPALRLTVSDRAVSTSAQSERGVDAGGRHHGHVLDPRTGSPAPSRASVSVVARDAARADALSTALLVMGRDVARAFASRHPDVGVAWLEPPARAGRPIRAWIWNLTGVAAEPGVPVEWMSTHHHQEDS